MSSEPHSAKAGVEPLPVPWVAEPFRLFFPLGLLCAFVGILIWPLWLGWPKVFRYPLIAHQALMIEGMIGAFALGFIGTAGPRMLGAAPMGRLEVIPALILFGAAMTAHLCGYPALGHLAFALTLAWWMLSLSRRWTTRLDLPPPGFPLVVFGLGSGVIGALASGLVYAGFAAPRWLEPANYLLETMFPLGLILGVGPFLLPRFFGKPSPHYFETMLQPSSGWLRELCLALLPLLLLAAAAIIHSVGHQQLAALITLFAVIAFMTLRFPLYCGIFRAPALPWLLRLSFVYIVVGMAGNAFFPEGFKVGWQHCFLIGGVFTLILAVSCRVIWGHAGEQFRFTQPSPALRFILAAIPCALGVRLLAEILIGTRDPLLSISALVLSAVLLMWTTVAGPALLKVDPD